MSLWDDNEPEDARNDEEDDIEPEFPYDGDEHSPNTVPATSIDWSRDTDPGDEDDVDEGDWDNDDDEWGV